MKRVHWALVVAGSIAVASITAAAVVVRVRWGYWIVQPAVEDLVDDVTRMHAFSTRWRSIGDEAVDSPDVAASTPQSDDDRVKAQILARLRAMSAPLAGVPALDKAAARADRTPGESPLGRIPARLKQRGLTPETDRHVDPRVLTGIRELLRASGQLVEGEAGYNHATDLLGHLAIVTTRDGSERVIASLMGREIADDLYTFYGVRARLEGGAPTRIEELRTFRFDSAGMEGLLHWMAGIGAAMLATLLWLVAWLLRAAARAVASRRLRRAART